MFEGTKGVKRGKEKENEKCHNNPSIHEYNVM
jgi:hypothetical protein